MLVDLCDEYGFPAAEVIDVLAVRGIEAEAAATLKEIAERSDSSPDEVYEAIRLGMAESR